MITTVWPCKGCTERHMGCHGSCEKYIAKNKEHQKKLAEAKKANDIIRYKNEHARKYCDDRAKHRKNHSGLHYKYSK